MFEFKFPDIGEGITEGKILKWFVNPGDSIKEGDSLFLVETDKVNAEIPSPVSGWWQCFLKECCHFIMPHRND